MRSPPRGSPIGTVSSFFPAGLSRPESTGQTSAAAVAFSIDDTARINSRKKSPFLQFKSTGHWPDPSCSSPGGLSPSRLPRMTMPYH